MGLLQRECSNSGLEADENGQCNKHSHPYNIGFELDTERCAAIVVTWLRRRAAAAMKWALARIEMPLSELAAVGHLYVPTSAGC